MSKIEVVGNVPPDAAGAEVLDLSTSRRLDIGMGAKYHEVIHDFANGATILDSAVIAPFGYLVAITGRVLTTLVCDDSEVLLTLNGTQTHEDIAKAAGSLLNRGTNLVNPFDSQQVISANNVSVLMQGMGGENQITAGVVKLRLWYFDFPSPEV